MDVLEKQRQIGLKIAYFRRLARLNQWDMSNALGVTTTWISLIERGHFRVSTELLMRIAKVLNCNLEDFRSENEE